MAPTIVLKDDKVRWVLGSPGGSTIITTVFWALVHLIDFDADTFNAIALPRVHEQWRPDVLAAWRRIDHAQAQVEVEDLKRFPTIAVQSGWTYQDQRKAIGFAGEPSWNAGMTFPLPVFDRNQGAIKSADVRTVVSGGPLVRVTSDAGQT